MGSIGKSRVWTLAFASLVALLPARALAADSLTLAKTVSTSGGCPGTGSVTVLAGTQVTECYVVTDTGDSSFTTIAISDNGTTLTIGSLAPGQSSTAIATVIAQATSSTSATATGRSAATGATVSSAPAPATIIVESPALSIVKTVSTSGACPGSPTATVLTGTTVAECYVVTNTGDTAISKIVVTDDGAALAIGGLAPGQSASSSRSVTASMTTSTGAVASGTDTALGDAVVSSPSLATIFVESPALSVAKTVSTSGTCPGSTTVTVLAGSPVTECYVVTNTGDGSIADIVVSDEQATLAIGSLAPGQSRSSSRTVTASFTSSTAAIASGTDIATGGAVSSPLGVATIVVESPHLFVQKTLSTNGTCPGSTTVTVLTGATVTECYAVTNTGDGSIASIVVMDAGATLAIGALAPGQSSTTAQPVTATVTSSTLAIASGTDVATGASVTSPPSTATIVVESPALTVQKTLSTDGTCPGSASVVVLAGTQVTECYGVTNTGDSVIGGTVVADAGAMLPVGTLAPGQSVTTSRSLTATATTGTSAIAYGTDVVSGIVVTSPPALATFRVVAPGLAIEKTLSADGSCPGSSVVTVLPGAQVTECYAVTNTGDTAIAGVVVLDNGATLPVGALAPGQTDTISATIVANTVTSTVAIASGTDVVTGTTITNSPSVATIYVDHPPTIACPGADNATCSDPQGASQTLTVALADADGDALAVTWNVDGIDVATHQEPSGATDDSFGATYAVGTHTVTVSVSDGHGGTASCSTTVAVADHFSLVGAVAVASLWPPDHDLVDVGYSVASTDPCASNPTISVAVYSNEPDLGADADNQFSPDAKGLAPGQLRLRRERPASSSGRVYLIVATGSDERGGHSLDCRTVVVPHDQSAASVSLVARQAATALATCRAGVLPAGFVPVGSGPIVGPKP
jgi:hypothetical protein